MIDWTFILIDGSTELEIDEPIGWADIAFEIVRDKRNHGISISYSLNEIKLIGEGAALVKSQYETYGVDAELKIKISALCDNEVQEEETFQLDFGRYNESCGEECIISIGIEEISCFATFNNNFDKKVDLRSQVAFDGATPLEQYDGLNKELLIPAKALLLQDRAETKDPNSYMLSDDINWDCNGCTNDGWDGYLLPPLSEVKSSSFGSFQPSPATIILRNCGGNNHPPYPDDVTVNSTELLTGIECTLSDATISFKGKGTLEQTVSGAGDPGVLLRAKIFKLPAGGDGGDCGTPGDWVELYSADLIDTRGLGSGIHSFDLEATITAAIAQGDLIHFGYYFAVQRVSQISSAQLNFLGDAENYFDLQTGALCETSTSDVFLVYETISRVAESITNACLKLESEYFGRVDSEPDSYPEDGCGSLEALTTGLYLRKAENPTFFISMKDLLNGLQCIHNTGFDLYRDGAQEFLRVKEVDFFYQDELLFDCSDADLTNKKVVPEEIPGTILGGYEKWEVENVNGLDEFNSKREYRLTIKNAKTQMDYRCKFVAGGYAIEITRQQSFAETGAADTKYDNETFILCLKRDILDYYPYPTYPYYAYFSNDFLVEQGNISAPDNLFDPDTVINFRISPIRNMMRLAKLFFGSYRDFTDIESKIVLSSGDGNILAEGFIPFDLCTPENQVMNESEEITEDKYLDEDRATPLIRPESITFDYPMSLSDFKKIRANPYGYITHCDGKGHIMKIIYRPNQGKANIELRNDYN